MSNPFYNVSGTPATGSPGASMPVRGEFAAIAAGFALLPPVLTANAIVVVNTGGTGMTVSSLATLLSSPPAIGGVAPAAGSFTSLATTAGDIDGVHSLSGGTANIQLLNSNTTAGTTAKLGVLTGTANSYGVLQVEENGSGASQLLIAAGAAVTQGILIETPTLLGITAPSGVSITGALAVSGTLGVAGNATVGGTLGVTGAVSGAAGSFTSLATTAGDIDGVHSLSGGTANIQLLNSNTTAGTTAKLGVLTGTANSYGVLQVEENGSGASQLLIAAGAAVTQGILIETPTLLGITAPSGVSITGTLAITGTLGVAGDVTLAGTSATPITSAVAGAFLNTAGSFNVYCPAFAPLAIGTGSTTLVDWFFGGPTLVGSVTTNGTTTAYNTTSDETLKLIDGSVSAADSAGVIDQLAAVWFRWQTTPDKPRQPGFSAQRTHAVFPWAVTPGTGTRGDSDYRPWQMDAATLMPMAVAELQALRRRIAALEAR